MENTLICGEPTTSTCSFLAVNKDVFMLFFAIAWGIVANVQGRWKAFHWPIVHRVPEARNRALLSFIILNILPFLYFGYVLWVLTIRGQTTSHRAIIAIPELILQGMLPALANFGFYRVWLGIIEWHPKWFYKKYLNDLPKEFRHVEPIVKFHVPKVKYDTPIIFIGPHTAVPNLTWGIIYLIASSISPWIRF